MTICIHISFRMMQMQMSDEWQDQETHSVESVLVELLRAPRTFRQLCAIPLQLHSRRRRQQSISALRNELSENGAPIHGRRRREASHGQPGRGVVNVGAQHWVLARLNTCTSQGTHLIRVFVQTSLARMVRRTRANDDAWDSSGMIVKEELV